jgi:uncharacterized protein (TIGR03382 family)
MVFAPMIRPILVLSLWVSLTAAAQSPIRIMPIGDSITQPLPAYASYRRPLWKLLEQTSYSVDFVGSTTAAAPPHQQTHTDFDMDHEGHSGWRIDEINAQLSGWASAAMPDIALVHLGTNDIFQSQTIDSSVVELGELIEILRAVNPKVIILLAQLIPLDNGLKNPEVTALNARIPEVAAAKSTEESPVIVVDQNTGFNAVTDTHDGAHPNEIGEEKMAQKWFAALEPVLAQLTQVPDSGVPDYGEVDAGELDGGEVPVDAGTPPVEEEEGAVEPPAQTRGGCSATGGAQMLVLASLAVVAASLRRRRV